jgi:hypothetical protein
MERLTLLALTDVAVSLGDDIIPDDDLSLLDKDVQLSKEDIKGITYQMAGWMVEVKSLPDDHECGNVIIPTIAVAAINKSLRLKDQDQRALLNPFHNNPTVLEVLAMESMFNMLQVYGNLRKQTMNITVLRPESRRWGRELTIRVPKKCTIVTQAEHVETNKSSRESNGNETPVVLGEGVCSFAAINQKATDSVVVVAEDRTGYLVLIVSLSKDHFEFSAKLGKPSESTIAKAEAKEIIDAMRQQASAMRTKLEAKSRFHKNTVIMVYDVFTTRDIGARLAKQKNPFHLEKNEIIFLTTSENIKAALGPVLSVRSTLKD